MSFLEPTVIGGLDRALLELLLVFAAIGGSILLLMTASIVGIIRAVRRRRCGKYSNAAVMLAAIAAGITALWLLYWMGHDIRERSNPVNALFAINLGVCVLPVAWLITAIRANAGRRERAL